MATARPNYYCHKCQAHIGHVTVRHASSLIYLISKNNHFRISNVLIVKKILSKKFRLPSQHRMIIPKKNSCFSLFRFSQSRSNPRRAGGAFHIHNSAPFGNTTIYFGGTPAANGANAGYGTADVGNFLHTFINQIAGGLTGAAGPLPV